MPTVAIVGAGLIGRAWAIVFARAGWDVRAHRPERRARSRPRRAHPRRRSTSSPRHGLVDDPAAAAARVTVVRLARRGGRRRRPRAGERARDWSRSSARIFAELDRAAPRGRDPRLLDLGHRRLALHRGPRRPRALPRRASGQPAAPRAGRRALRRALDLAGRRSRGRARSTRASARCRSTCNREIDGFVLNRLQGALLAEAFRLVGEGVVSAAGSRQDDHATGSACAGPSWGRSRRSSSTRPAASPTTAPATRRASAATSADPPPPSVWDERELATRRRGLGRAPHDRARSRARARWRDKRLAALAAHKRASNPDEVRDPTRQTPQEPWPQAPQSHHHLRRHRRDPHAVDVAAPADHAGGDRRRRDRRRRGRRRDRPPARARPEDGRPDQSPGGLRAVPAGDQAALELRHQHHHRRRADHDRSRSACSPRAHFKPEVASLNMGSMNFGLYPMLDALQGVQARLGAALPRGLATTASSRTPSRTSRTS